MSTFAIYVMGFIVMIAGLAWAADRLGVSTIWIAIGVIILLGLGILTGATRAKRPDPPA